MWLQSHSKEARQLLAFFFNGWNTHSLHPEIPCEKPDYLEAILLWGGLSHMKEQWAEVLVPRPNWALPWSHASADRVEKLPSESSLQLFTSSQLRLQLSWRKEEPSSLCPVWIPDPQDPWVSQNHCYSAPWWFGVLYHTAVEDQNKDAVVMKRLPRAGKPCRLSPRKQHRLRWKGDANPIKWKGQRGSSRPRPGRQGEHQGRSSSSTDQDKKALLLDRGQPGDQVTSRQGSTKFSSSYWRAVRSPLRHYSYLFYCVCVILIFFFLFPFFILFILINVNFI